MRNEPEAGLCATCEHSRRVISGKGSVFRLCRLSATDPRYAKYPRLPVIACAGYRRREGGEPADPGAGPRA